MVDGGLDGDLALVKGESDGALDKIRENCRKWYVRHSGSEGRGTGQVEREQKGWEENGDMRQGDF